MGEMKMPENRKLKVTILDLKWSYGIEQVSVQVYRQLEKYGPVSMLGAAEATFPEAEKIAPSRTYAQMLAAFVNPLTYVRIFRHLRRQRTDVLYITSPHLANFLIVILCRVFTQVFIISHVHDPECFGRKTVAWAADALSYLQCKFSHRVYCWGSAIKDAITRRFRIPPEKVAVFQHGPGQSTLADTGGTAEVVALKYFALIGTLHERKGIDVFLEAAKRFNAISGKSSIRFLLAGAGNIERYKSLIDAVPNLTVENRFIPDDEVNELLQSSYALVLPYVGGMMQTSFIAIAYGNGCPVIVSRNGSMFEEVEHGSTGYIVERNNASELADAMVRLSRDETRRAFSRNCLSYYRAKFSWEVIGKEMHEDTSLQLNGNFTLKVDAVA